MTTKSLIDQSSSFNNVVEAASIAEAFWTRASAEPHSLLYRYAVAPNAAAARVWRSETYASCSEKIARVAHYLSTLGVGPGTSVAILSHTRPEWMLTDIAVQSLGGITVSIYQSLPWHEVGYILFDSKATIVCIENEEQAEKIRELRLTPCPIPEREGFPGSEVSLTVTKVITFEKVESLTDSVSFHALVQDAEISSEPPPIPHVGREDIASIVYTSGTTGPPKGVPQTHHNHLSNVRQASESGVFLLDGSLFLYLPLAHSFARLAYYVGFLTSASLVLPAVVDHRTSKVDLASVARDIREGGAAVIPSVPRLYEKMAAALQARAAGRGLQQRILALCISNAREIYNLRKQGKSPGILQSVIYQGLSKVRAKIKNQLFGSQFRHGISGGAKLDPAVATFFDTLGMVICEGYGLTETCVATHVNLPHKRVIGSVGSALQGVEVRITPEDGEILLRGPNVTKGYLNRPQATAESWDSEGWFHTGDIGRVDQDGFLYITDRKKELVITAGGKKIPPQSVEGLFKRYPFISQSFFYGEGRPYCVMLFTLNEQETRLLLEQRGIKLAPDVRLASLDHVRSMIEEAVQFANNTLASYESVKRYAILDEDFTIENGLLTPTLKMKRKMVVGRYMDVIEGLYRVR